MQKKVLVTGGAGFIGSHVADELLEMGFQVTILDDLSGGFQENVPKGCRFVEGSVLDHDLVTKIFSENSFDYVFHSAAYAAEGLSHFIKRFNYNNNVIGSINIINECIKTQVKCLIFTSSIAVYGINQLPMTEDLVPHPEDSYGIAKYAVEMELRASHEMFGLDYVIFRPHNVYGERQNLGDKYRNVIGIFMNNIMKGKPLPIFGDGTQTRAFSYIRDIAPIMAQAFEREECYGEIFNIGADQHYSINELSDMVNKVMGTNAPKVFYLPRNEVKHAYSDHRKVAKFFSPCMTSLEDGLRNMSEWAIKTGIRKSKDFQNIEITRNLPASWAKNE